MTQLARWGAVVFVCAAALLTLIGCSSSRSEERTVSKVDVAAQISSKAARKPDSVNCRGDLPVRVGAALECEMMANGRTYDITVTVKSVDGDNVKFDIAETVNMADIADQISGQLAQQSGVNPTVTCPDKLNGTVGETTRCQLQEHGSTYGVTVTVTGVDAGDVRFSFVVDAHPE